MNDEITKFTFVSSVGWKYYPDRVGDAPYLMENLEDYDLNEDHICGVCGKEIPGRFLNCSQHCHILFEKYTN